MSRSRILVLAVLQKCRLCFVEAKKGERGQGADPAADSSNEYSLSDVLQLGSVP